jgi:hypothetical protein
MKKVIILLILLIYTDAHAGAWFGASEAMPSGTSCVLSRNSSGTAACTTTLSLGNDAAQIYDTTDSTKLLLLSPAGSSASTTTTIATSSTTARTITLPDRTGTVAMTAVEVVSGATHFHPTALQVSGTMISNYGQTTADVMVQLPTAVAGMNFRAIVGTAQAGNYWRFQADTNDKIYFDGTAGSDNGYVQQAAAVVGSYMTCFTFQTGASAYDWICKSGAGTWAAGGP